MSTADRRHSEVVLNQRETNDSGASSVVETRLIVKREALSLSLSLSPESYDLREELAKIVVLSIVGAFVNEESVLEIIPSIINAEQVGSIVPLNELFFLLPFDNREEVREIVKLGMFEARTKDGMYKLNLAYWTAEIGALGRATGEGHWVNIWNLPLHGWC